MAELGTAADPNVKLDDRRVQLMRNVLQTDSKKQFGTYGKCLESLKENLPAVKLELLHQADYKDMRDAVKLTLSDQDKLPERLEALTDILKEPKSFHKHVSDFVISVEQERRPEPTQKKNNNSGKLGL